ncbi:hypothetical protein F5Y16DRAFT_332946 [Xylariaceae sp. FL0255]|nr:hypothetical protein F5Y16DRAFT_332946 [Xylariaceae sp. FL0255]
MPSSSTLSFVTMALLSAQAALGTPMGKGPDGPDRCPKTTTTQGYTEPYVADIGFYSDKDCIKEISYDCVYVREKWIKDGKGSYQCNNSKLPKHTPFYAKVRGTAYPDIQMLFTEDQSCPPSGAGAVFASLVDNSACVELNLGGNAPGISVYPHGGAPLSRRNDGSLVVDNSNSLLENEKRASDKCKGFKHTSSKPSESKPVKVSAEVDCTNAGSGDCTITKSKQHTKSVTTSYSVDSGITIDEVFDIGATFGQDYTSGVTTTLQYGFSVDKGQKGYLTAYSDGTLFKGEFTDCDSGKNHAGEVLAVKKNSLHYLVVDSGI